MRTAFALSWVLALGALAQTQGATGEMRIQQTNRMGARFKLIRAEYSLDGKTLYSESDEAKLRDQQNVPIATQALAPGKHELTVALVYRGAGAPYATLYKYNLKNSAWVDVQPSQSIEVNVIAHERGGLTTPVEKRPVVEIQTNVPTQKGISLPEPSPPALPTIPPPARRR